MSYRIDLSSLFATAGHQNPPNRNRILHRRLELVPDESTLRSSLGVGGDVFICTVQILTALRNTTKLRRLLRNRWLVRILYEAKYFDWKESPLHQCIRNNLTFQLEMLLQAGVNVNAVEMGNRGLYVFCTPLELACQMNHVAAVKILLKFGANAGRALEMINVTHRRYKRQIVCLLEDSLYKPSTTEQLLSQMTSKATVHLNSLRSELAEAQSIQRHQRILNERIELLNNNDPEAERRFQNTAYLLRLESKYRSSSCQNRLQVEINQLEQLLSKLPNVMHQPTQSDSSTEEESKVDKVLRCPVCLDVPFGCKVLTCNGCHNFICGRCRDAMSDEAGCPVCRYPILPRNRNIALERIIEGFSG